MDKLSELANWRMNRLKFNARIVLPYNSVVVRASYKKANFRFRDFKFCNKSQLQNCR